MKTVWRWVIVGVCLIVLPFMQPVWDLAVSRGSRAGDRIPLALGGMLFAFLVAYLLLIKRETRAIVYVCCVALCGVCLLISASLTQPIERVHLTEYALLSMLVFWAMADGAEGPGLCFWAVLVTVQLGFVDELFQGLLPSRIYDFNDLVLNAEAAALGQGVLAGVIRPWERNERSASLPVSTDQPGMARMWSGLAVVIVLAALIIYCLELGTPTMTADVHRTDGALKHRDGLRYCGSAVMYVSGALWLTALSLLISSRRAKGRGAGRLRATIICGLIPLVIVVAGKLAGVRLR